MSNVIPCDDAVAGFGVVVYVDFTFLVGVNKILICSTFTSLRGRLYCIKKFKSTHTKMFLYIPLCVEDDGVDGGAVKTVSNLTVIKSFFHSLLNAKH